MQRTAFMRIGALAMAAALLSLSSIASACSIVVAEEGNPATKMRAASASVRSATAIIDGEVVRPFTRDGQTALVRAEHVLKGPRQSIFEVGERDSCDIALERPGERLRLFLDGGPGIYFASIDTSDPEYEDRLLHSDRRKVWPYREGSSPPQPRP
jgi:hypothetical protein